MIPREDKRRLGQIATTWMTVPELRTLLEILEVEWMFDDISRDHDELVETIKHEMNRRWNAHTSCHTVLTGNERRILRFVNDDWNNFAKPLLEREGMTFREFGQCEMDSEDRSL